jgi:hypothetical protein
LLIDYQLDIIYIIRNVEYMWIIAIYSKMWTNEFARYINSSMPRAK